MDDIDRLMKKLAWLGSPAAAGRMHRVPRTGSRQYASARIDRLTLDWGRGASSSADQELASGLKTLRDRSRALVRDASYAKRARVTVVSNVIGAGIGMQAQVMNARGDLHTRINDEIEDVFEEWSDADSCHTGGRLGFHLMERAAMAQVFDAGEVFFRIHRRRFGASRVPLALELIEAERIADDYAEIQPAQRGNIVRMGVEVDRFHRPQAYWIHERHRGEQYLGDTADRLERVPAEDIIHLCLIDRWPQTRGEPWLHTAARRLNDMDGYSEAEIVRARAQASVPWTIETDADADSFGDEQADGSVVMDVEPGTASRLNPGEKMNAPSPNSPNPALDPFMRYMLREVAAGAGVSYESISRDYSQSNYSSSRLGILEDRDLWRFYQSWFITDFRQRVHREFVRAATMAGVITSIPLEQYAVRPRKYEAVAFKPRGWMWVDPTKEVFAYKEAVRAGFTTVTDVIANTAGGLDIEDMLKTRKQELALMETDGLVFDTSPASYMGGKADEKRPREEIEEPQGASDDDGQQKDSAAGRVYPFHTGAKA